MLSSNQNERENQAEDLRKLVYDLESGKEENEQSAGTEPDEREIDILNLPPRKEVHGNKQNRVRLKMSTSFKRFLLVIFVLVVVLGGMYYFYGAELLQIFNN